MLKGAVLAIVIKKAEFKDILELIIKIKAQIDDRKSWLEISASNR